MTDPRTPLEIAKQKVVDADAALQRASAMEDYKTSAGIVGTGAVLAGGALTAGGITAPVGVAAGAAGVAGVGTYIDARNTTDAAVAAAKEARRAYNDEADKVGAQHMDVDVVDYQARPWQTDPTRRWNESVQPVVDDVVEGAESAYKSVSEALSGAFDSVAGSDGSDGSDVAIGSADTNAVMEISPEAADMLSSTYDEVTDTVSTGYDTAADVAESVFDAAVDARFGDATFAAEVTDSGAKASMSDPGTTFRDPIAGTNLTVDSEEALAEAGTQGLHLKYQRDAATWNSADALGDYVQLSAHAGEAWGEVDVNQHGGQLGAHADIAGADVRIGSEQNNLKVGLSAGEGLGIGYQTGGDSDGDGYEEWGMSGEGGPLSVGFKVEPGYVADQVAEGATAAYDAAGTYADEAYDSAAETATEVYDSASNYVDETYDSAAETVSEVFDSISFDGIDLTE